MGRRLSMVAFRPIRLNKYGMKSVAPQNGPLAMRLSVWPYDPNKQGIEGYSGAGRKEVILPVPLWVMCFLANNKALPYGRIFE